MISRKKLLDAAAKVFAECGFRGATTRRIADEAGVNEVTLFRHFGSKSQLLAEAVECMHPMADCALPEEPGDMRRELVAWCDCHLRALRKMRGFIRKTMAELEEHPELAPVVSDAKTPHFERLVAYCTRAVRPATADERESLRTACTMLLGALFMDAMGRDTVPGIYPGPSSTAAKKYVQVFLSMLNVRQPVRRRQSAVRRPRPRTAA